MFKYIAAIFFGILLAAPLVAEITPFPASFHTQMVPTRTGARKMPSPLENLCTVFGRNHWHVIPSYVWL